MNRPPSAMNRPPSAMPCVTPALRVSRLTRVQTRRSLLPELPSVFSLSVRSRYRIHTAAVSRSAVIMHMHEHFVYREGKRTARSST
eukprot:1191753-Prorocentrum_minimum.AAC.1